jgi:alpha/beta superfamily hydrolase
MSLPLEDWRGDTPGVSASLRIPGPVGVLELLATCPGESASAPSMARGPRLDPIGEARAVDATAIVCHPHPLHGGTLNNKVVHTVARTFDALGARTVRFNFRGVGASEGQYDHGDGETEDLLTILDWVRERRPHDAIWLAGFSFGAYVALRAVAHCAVARLIAIAPPVNLYDFSGIRTPTCPTWIVQGEQDEVVPSADVLSWAARLDPRPAVLRLDAGHFFHQRLNALRDALTSAFQPA